MELNSTRNIMQIHILKKYTFYFFFEQAESKASEDIGKTNVANNQPNSEPADENKKVHLNCNGCIQKYMTAYLFTCE